MRTRPEDRTASPASPAAPPSAGRRQARAGIARGWEVLAAMSVAALREERDFTVTGVLKWVIEPLLLTAVYFVLVATVFRRSEDAFLLFLLCALLPFRYFSGVVGRSLALVPRHSSILINRSFPRSVLPLVTVVTEGLSFAVSLLLLAPLMAYYIAGGDSEPPSLALLWLPLIVLVLAVITTGASYIAAVFGLYFPDFRAMVASLIRVLFFLSTGLVRFARVPGEELPQLLRANPLSGIFDSVRDVVINAKAPRAVDVLYPLAVGIALLVVGLLVYRWREPHFAKEV